MNNRYTDVSFDAPTQKVHKNTISRPVPPTKVQNRPHPQNTVQNPMRKPAHQSVQRMQRPSNTQVQTRVQNQGGEAVIAKKKTTAQNFTLGQRASINAKKVFRDVIRPLFASNKEKPMNTVEVVKKPFPMRAILVALLSTVIVAAMIFSYIQINEYTIQVSELRSEVSDLLEKDKELTSSLEQKNDMSTIEAKAIELGMVKANQLTKKHVNLTSEDKVEVVETKSGGDSDIVTTIMSGIFSNFGGLSDYFSN